MCQAIGYRSTTCRHPASSSSCSSKATQCRWLTITNPCRPGLGFNTHAHHIYTSTSNPLTGKTKFHDAIPGTCPNCDLRGDYDGNKTRMVMPSGGVRGFVGRLLGLPTARDFAGMVYEDASREMGPYATGYGNGYGALGYGGVPAVTQFGIPNGVPVLPMSAYGVGAAGYGIGTGYATSYGLGYPVNYGNGGVYMATYPDTPVVQAGDVIRRIGWR